MISFSDPIIVKELFSLIHKINKDFKNIYCNKDVYFMCGKKIFSCGPLQLDKITGFVNINKLKKNAKDLASEKIYDNLDRTEDYPIAINGKEFFHFQQMYNNNVNGLIFDENGLTVTTDIPGISFNTNFKEYRERYLKSVDDINKISHMINGKLVGEFEMDYDTYVKMNNYRSIVDVYLNFSDSSISLNETSDEYYLKLKFSSNLFVRFIKTTICNINVYSSLDDDKIFAVEIILKNAKCTSFQYFKVIDY